MLAAALLAAAVGCGAPEGARLGSGQTRVFPAGVLRIGNVVSCDSHGVRAKVRVPPLGDAVTGVANGLRGNATVHVLARNDGSVVAGCT